MAEEKPLQLKDNYTVSYKFEPFYSGGKVQFSGDGQRLLCTCGTKVQVLDVSTGKVMHTIAQEDEEDVTCFVLSPDDEVMVTASRAMLLRQWAWRDAAVCQRTWKAVHVAPIVSMAFDATSTLLATGSSDATIKVWDIVKQYCTHNFRGSSGVVGVVAFHPDTSCPRVLSAASDCKIRVWDLQSGACSATLDGHYSAVTALRFACDGRTLLSAGRDSVVLLWELEAGVVRKTVPVYEPLEDLVVLPEEGDQSALGVEGKGIHFVTAGSKGTLRVWDAANARCVFTAPPPEAGSPGDDAAAAAASAGPGDGAERTIVQAHLVPALGQIAAVTSDHNIILHALGGLTVAKQFVGYNDEVLDVKFLGKTDSHVAVATNSAQIKIFQLDSSHCQLLHGHRDMVLALDVSRRGTMLASSSKDRTVRVWSMEEASGHVRCVAVATGHAHAVGAVAWSRLKDGFLVSGSQDCTLKLWDLPKGLSSSGTATTALTCRFTEKAHDKDVNSVAVSPNDRLVASGSQDHTVRLWAVAAKKKKEEEGGGGVGPVAVLRGHRRGVWAVAFSPMDQVVASASADGSVRLWGLHDFACLKTFEGHDASVLKVVFVARGTQLLTSGSDGLVKLWTIKTNECVRTLDAHDGKVWGLHGSRDDERVLTGGSDACIVLWKDVTQEEQEEERKKEEEQLLKRQELSNLLHEKKYLKALRLAISLDQPHTTLTVIQAILDETGGREDLEATIAKLRQDQKESLLKFAVTWNTNSRSCHEAHAVLATLFRHVPPGDLLRFANVQPAVEALLPYSERHFQRMGRLLQAAMFVDYTWRSMRLLSDFKSTDAMEVDGVDAARPSFRVDKIGARPPSGNAATADASDGSVSGFESESESESSDDDDCKATAVPRTRRGKATPAPKSSSEDSGSESELSEEDEEKEQPCSTSDEDSAALGFEAKPQTKVAGRVTRARTIAKGQSPKALKKQTKKV
ncbi:transducin beta-like protein 3 isoform X1 [Petromyzon marinus]|uniref:transducin beta-like protein 3 isoform X1 n=2 Tax=Petromyzon marinus TaxID=7757 RepID=UPI003F72AC0B